MRSDSLYTLPENLPVPIDDGGSAHLRGLKIPDINLKSTSGKVINTGEKTNHYRVFFLYPRTGNPNEDPPGGLEEWNNIPGARGCTPQICAYRDEYSKLQALGVELFGISTQTTGYQKEAVVRLNLLFDLLSDSELELANSLNLPVFRFDSAILFKRITFISRKGIIEQVFYPVFPPDHDAKNVIDWL